MTGDPGHEIQVTQVIGLQECVLAHPADRGSDDRAGAISGSPPSRESTMSRNHLTAASLVTTLFTILALATLPSGAAEGVRRPGGGIVVASGFAFVREA